MYLETILLLSLDSNSMVSKYISPDSCKCKYNASSPQSYFYISIFVLLYFIYYNIHPRNLQASITGFFHFFSRNIHTDLSAPLTKQKNLPKYELYLNF